MPRVSIIVPAFNRANWLPYTVRSVLAQTMPDFELIVVDDGSTDSTRELMESFAQNEPRVRYVYQENQGRSVARNNGAALAQGDYIGVLDSDDEYLPTTLESHLAVFESDPRLGMTVGGYDDIDDTGVVLGERTPWLEGGSLDLAGWLFNCYAIPGAVLAQRDWFLKSGGYDPLIRSSDDWDHFLQMALYSCPMDWVKQSTCRYRQHSGNTVRSGRITGVRNNQAGMKRALTKVFSSPLVSPDVAKLQSRALGWASVQIAKMFFLAGEVELGTAELTEAYKHSPDLFNNGASEVLQYLLMPAPAAWGSSKPFTETELHAWLPKQLGLSTRNIRLARARLEMADFFRARSTHDNTKAMQHLNTGLRLDPRWLANRGVLSFYVKWAFHRL
jgi:hypothetical protein